MSDLIKLRVVRPCWLLGRVAEVGDVVKLPADDAITAVNSGRCEVYDDIEAASLRIANQVEREKLAARLAREARR